MNSARPRTFNEFVNNFKVIDVKRKSFFSDKVKLKSQLKELFNIDVNTATILKIFSSGSELKCFNFNDFFVGSFVVKSNHGSGMNRFYKIGEVPTENDLSLFNKWFKFPSHISSRELHYSLIEKKIFVEASLGQNLSDFKVYCFNGVCSIIQVDVNRFSNHERAIFNRNWQLINLDYVYQQPESYPQKPLILVDMLEKSEEIASNFIFVRVDWYVCDNQLFLGELTFHPEGGLGPFNNRRDDIEFLKMLIQG